MKTSMRTTTWAVMAVVGLAVSGAWAQPRPPVDRRLGLQPVQVTDAAKSAAARVNASEPLDKILQSTNNQLRAALDGTRKFDIVSVEDLKELLSQQEGPNRNLAGMEGFAFAGCRYSMIVKVDDFQDIQIEHTMRFGPNILERVVRLSCVVEVWDNTNGTLLRSGSFSVQTPNKAEELGTPGGPAKVVESAVMELARETTFRAALYMTDQIFPLRVVSRNGTRVTLNRGEWFRYPPGLEFEVFAMGDEQTDPDTGRPLGREEKRVGRVRVTSSTPEMTEAEVVEETGAIERGAVARLPANAAAPAGQPSR